MVAVWIVALIVKNGPGESLDGDAPAWPSPEAKHLDAVQFSGEGGEFALVHNATGWFVSQDSVQVLPLADQTKVDALLDFISKNRPSRDLGEYKRSEARGYGLKEPMALLFFRGEKGFTLTIGGHNPTGDGIYALLSTAPERLFLLGGEYARFGRRSAGYYQEMKVFRASEDGLARFGVSGGRRGWSIQANKKDYAFLTPERLQPSPVSASQAKFMVHNLTGLEAEALVLNATVQRGEMLLTVNATDEKYGPQSMSVFDAGAGGLLLGNSTHQPVPFLLTAETVNQLNKTAFEMRDRKVISVDTSRVEGFVISKGDRTLAAQRTETGWKDEESGNDILGIDMTLWRLTELKFEKDPSGEMPAKAESVMTWRLLDGGNKTVAAMSFYSDPTLPAQLCWLQISEKEDFYPVSNQLLTDLQGQLPTAGPKGTGQANATD